MFQRTLLSSFKHVAAPSCLLTQGARTFRSSAVNCVEVGEKVPSVIFKTRVRDESAGDSKENPFIWKDVSSEDLFKGKRAVLFALPGAFTPTCSSTHLPGYERSYERIKSLGIDEIYCLSVNDAFVMNQWGKHLGVSNVKLIPDGACLFTRGMDMSCFWIKERGFGERSWRYSAVINDMKVEKLFVEAGGVIQDSGPDPFEVSDCDTMIKYLESSK